MYARYGYPGGTKWVPSEYQVGTRGKVGMEGVPRGYRRGTEVVP